MAQRPAVERTQTNTGNPLTSPMPHNSNPMEKQFAPKVPVELNEPKQDLISKEELAKANGAEVTFNQPVKQKHETDTS